VTKFFFPVGKSRSASSSPRSSSARWAS
jgi:hypothetical protein